jgi:hypothetical protein
LADGLAACKRANSEIRVVHELLLDRTLAGRDVTRITEALLSALEMVAHQDGVGCMTFWLGDGVAIAPFEERGYTSLALDGSGVWLQRKFGWLGWSEIRSAHPTLDSSKNPDDGRHENPRERSDETTNSARGQSPPPGSQPACNSV